MSRSYLFVFGLVIALSVYNVAGFCTPCGTDCCNDDETCEESVGSGTCYKKSDKVTCDSTFYCYSPTTCCGFMSCCPEGSYCSDSLCYSNDPLDIDGGYSTYTYVAIVCGSITVGCLILSLIIRAKRAQRLQQQRRVVTGGVVNAVAVGPQPPPYTVSTTTTSAYSGPNAYNTAYGNAGFNDSTRK